MRRNGHWRTRAPRNAEARGRKRASEGGFTLIELMIAAGITMIGFVLMFSAIVNVSTVATINEDEAQSALLTSSLLEDIRNMSTAQLAAYQAPALPGVGTSASIQVFAYNDEGNAVALPLDEGGSMTSFPNPTEIQVVLTWTDHAGRTNSVHSSTGYRR
jgi:type II secretory pathway pseudopilin PulG